MKYQVIDLLTDKVLFECYDYDLALQFIHENRDLDSPVLDIRAVRLKV